MSRWDNATEDLMIQETLSMNTEQRLELLAHLMVGKIIDDQKNGGALLHRAGGVSNA